MKLEEMQEVLKRNGIDAEVITVYRNGIPKTGFRICTGAEITPIVYFSPDATEEQMLVRIDEALHMETGFQTELLKSKEHTLKNSMICVQRQSDDPILKRSFENLEAYVRINLPWMDREGSGGTYSIKATEAYIDSLGLTASRLWEEAFENTRRNLVVREMGEVLASFGHPLADEPFQMFIATTREGTNGASAILYPDLFGNLCREKGLSGCLILPSSIHELMVVPEEGLQGSLPELAGIVDEINGACVEPEDQLIPAVYRYTLQTNEIHLAATLAEVDKC